MKESRFIELVNLYVDHELTSADAAELEAELQRAPARRAVLREYRALQRGCELLADVDRSLAPRTAEAVRALRHRRTEEGTSSRVWFGAWPWVAGATAAAVVAVVAVFSLDRFNAQPNAVGAVVATADPAQRAVTGGAGASTLEMLDVAVPAAPTETKGLRMRSLWMPASAERASAAGLVAVASSDLSWMDDVRLPAVRSPRPEDLLFRERAVPARAVEPMPPSQRPLQATLEMTAFQFQR